MLELLGGLATALRRWLLACWIYSAVVAIFVPSALPLAFDGVLPVRTDSAGEAAYVVSLALVIGAIGAHARRCGEKGRAVRATIDLSRSVAVYAGLLWAYLSGNSITHRFTLDQPVTHFASWPTEGQTAAGALAVAFVATAVWLAVQERCRRADLPACSHAATPPV